MLVKFIKNYNFEKICYEDNVYSLFETKTLKTLRCQFSQINALRLMKDFFVSAIDTIP